MPGPDVFPRAAEQHETPVDSLLKEYSNKYQEARHQVETMTHANVRSQLEDFLKNNQIQMPEHQEQIMENEEQMREVLSYALTIQRSEDLRTQLLTELQHELSQNASNRFQILRDRLQQVSQNEVIDIMLVKSLLQQILDQEANQIQQYYAPPDKQSLVQAGKTWLESGGERPKEFQEQLVPQQLAFNSFRLNVLFQERFQQVREQFTKDIRSLDAFVQATYEPYRQFLESKGFDLNQFCPSQAFYKKLCEGSGIQTELMQSMDVRSIVTASGLQASVEAQQKVVGNAQERLDFHRKERQRLQARAGLLRDRAKKLKDAGNSSEAAILETEAQGIDQQIQQQSANETYYKNLLEGAKGAQEQLADAVRSSEAALALFPGHPNVSYLGPLGKPFTWTSQAFDWVGRHVPEPGSLYNMNARDMMWGVAKMGLSAGVLINGIKLGTITFNRWSQIPGDIKRLDVGKGIRNLVGGVTDIFTEGRGTLITGAAAAGAVALVDHPLAVQGAIDRVITEGKRIAGTESVTVTSDWLARNVGPLLSKGAEGLKEFFIGGKNTAGAVMGWGAEQWKDLKAWGNELGVNVDEYKTFFDTMKATQERVGTELSSQDHLKALGYTSGTLGVSTDRFATVIHDYARRSQGRAASEPPLPLSLEQLADAGFLYKNNTRLTRETLLQDDNYRQLASNQRHISIPADLSQQLIQQEDFWNRVNSP